MKNEKIWTWYRFKLENVLRTEEGVRLFQAGGELIVLLLA